MSEREATVTPLELVPSDEKQISAGRILYLTKDPVLIRRQIENEQLAQIFQSELLDNISTDEIIPNRACLTYTGKEEGYLGKHLMTGLRGGVIKVGEVAAGNFQTIVAGSSFAKGSSRIHAPLALQEAGIKLIIAEAERIFSENCINLQIHLLNPRSKQAQKLLAGKSVPDAEILNLPSPQSRDIMKSGGLLKYLRSIEAEEMSVPELQTEARPMTIAEKIISKKSLNPNGSIGASAVKPGDEVVAMPDRYYGYELQTNAMIKALREEFGDEIKTRRSEKVLLYNDHTALLKDDATTTLRHEQALFASLLNIRVYEIDPKRGAPAICHTDVVENHALPGELILGNDSHTCTVGVLNTLAVGKGTLDLAGAIAYDRMILTVPETIRVNLTGELPKGVTMKDFMLQFGALSELKSDDKKTGIASGRMLEFGGKALNTLPFDEQIKLTNMSVELLGFSGVTEPSEPMIEYLMNRRRLSRSEIEKYLVRPDKNASYYRTFDIDLAKIEPTIALPGDTQNGQPLSAIRGQNIRIDKAYVGSCTHGTVGDLRQASEVLRGRKIAEGIKLYVQASSIDNLKTAEHEGYIRVLLDAGAELLPIGCGACMNAGPGSVGEGEVGIFATNRNFPGRTGRGQTYLSSPAIAAASAVKGIICGPEDLDLTPPNF